MTRTPIQCESEVQEGRQALLIKTSASLVGLQGFAGKESLLVQKLGFTASLVIRLINLLLVCASHKKQSTMADMKWQTLLCCSERKSKTVLLGKACEIQGIYGNILGVFTEKEEQELLSERAHKQVMTEKMNMHLILRSSTRTVVTVTVTISTALGKDSTAKGK